MMKRILYRQGGWMPLFLLVLLCLIATPVSAAGQARQQRRATATNLNASVYLTTDSLKPLFQQQISQQVTNLSSSTINSMLGSLPAADQAWARAMAGALIQPSATLTQLTPQSNGLDTRISLSLYPGDPKPINAAMLTTFSVRDASTIQVNAQPVPGSPQLANGPLTTLTVPIGQLESINTTPGCGDVGLQTNIQVPVTLNTASSQSQNNQVAQSTLPANQTLADTQQSRQMAYTTVNRAANTLNAYVEIPNSSLMTLGSSISPIPVGTIPFNNTLTAENLRISTQGNGLVINSDIFAEPPLHPKLATATTNVQLSVENGNLVMHVPHKGTTITVAGFNVSTDSYNQKIEDMLNSNIGGALAGKFTVTGVSVGGTVPCAQSDSLILQGTTSLG